MLVAVIAVALGAAVGLLAGRRPPGVGAGAGGVDLAILAGGVAASLAGDGLGPAGAALALSLGGHALLLAFAVRHRRNPGMVILAAGLLSNLVVMAADDGMPVATLATGISVGLHHGMAASDHLRGLADIIAVPAVGLTVSPGDLVMALGGAVAAFAWLTAPGPAGRPVPPLGTDGRPSAQPAPAGGGNSSSQPPGSR